MINDIKIVIIINTALSNFDKLSFYKTFNPNNIENEISSRSIVKKKLSILFFN